MGLLCGLAMTMTAMKMVGLESGLRWEAVGLSGFMVEVLVVVGLPIWCWWAMGCGSRF